MPEPFNIGRLTNSSYTFCAYDSFATLSGCAAEPLSCDMCKCDILIESTNKPKLVSMLTHSRRQKFQIVKEQRNKPKLVPKFCVLKD